MSNVSVEPKMVYMSKALKAKIRQEKRKREDSGLSVTESAIVCEALDRFFGGK